MSFDEKKPDYDEQSVESMRDLLKYLHRAKLDVPDFIAETEDCESLRSFFTHNGREVCLNEKGFNFLMGRV